MWKPYHQKMDLAQIIRAPFQTYCITDLLHPPHGGHKSRLEQQSLSTGFSLTLLLGNSLFIEVSPSPGLFFSDIHALHQAALPLQALGNLFFGLILRAKAETQSCVEPELFIPRLGPLLSFLLSTFIPDFCSAREESTWILGCYAVL